MNAIILRLEIRTEQDVVLARQRTREISQMLSFNPQEQTKMATAVSEIARNAFQYAGGGKVEFWVEGTSPQYFQIGIADRGPGIPNLKQVLDGQYVSSTGIGLGIVGTRRLMDLFEIKSVPGQGTNVLLGKTLPPQMPPLTAKRLEKISNELVRKVPESPFEEIQQQNQELLQALAALRKREEELVELNNELEDTNRGVVALYAELEEKADSLGRVNEIKTRFLSNMSHEFRTPLNSIMSLSQMLLHRMDGELTEEQEKQVMLIRKSAEELSELVNDFLDLAKVEAGKVEINPSQFEVSELFGTLRGMLRPLLGQNSKVTLIFEDSTEVPTLHTDRGKLTQILRNLVSNALKYTEEGEVRVSVTKKGDRVLFSIADTGIGIAPEDCDRIFEEFVQVHSRLQNQVKGTGLGLPLSRKLAQLLGGNISLTTQEHVGSTFFLSIPVIYSAASAASPLPLTRRANYRESGGGS